MDSYIVSEIFSGLIFALLVIFSLGAGCGKLIVSAFAFEKKTAENLIQRGRYFLVKTSFLHTSLAGTLLEMRQGLLDVVNHVSIKPLWVSAIKWYLC